MKYIDLHVHSNCSDGSLSPKELVEYAYSHNVSVFSLSDHDTVNGCNEALQTAEAMRKEGKEITVLPSIEISAAYKKRDIHILGQIIDYKNKALLSKLQELVDTRNQRNDKMIARFEELGIHISYEDLLDGVSDTVITRAHFARALQKMGIVSVPSEAFDKYIGPDGPCYVPRGFMSPKETIELILSSGGVPVLAHPLTYGIPHEELFKLIGELKDYGLVGIETFYSSNKGDDEATVKGLASHFNLIMTGGSDYHGKAKPGLEIGCGFGNLNVPHELLQTLYKASEKIRSAGK